MLRREARGRIRDLLRQFPAVALLGPRQAGKTTLARGMARRYYDLEQEPDRLRLDLEWDEVAPRRALVVMDEAEAHPDLFPRLRAAIDAARRRNGRFLLLGSVSPAPMRQVSESLAGRLAVVELAPFLLPEIPPGRLDRLWLMGGFPEGGILKPAAFPEWQFQYLDLLTQRDLPQWGLPARPATTTRFVKMVMAAHGSLWNASEIGRGLGLSYHTVNTYLEYLEGAFLVRRLPPYAASLRKRLVRSPKVYWRDTGLLHALQGVTDMDSLLTRPWVGASWEGFVIEQVLGWLQARGRRAEAFHFRTSDGHEVDLVIELDRLRWAIEIKLTTSPGRDDFARLAHAAGLLGADRHVLLSRASRTVESAAGISTNLPGLLDLLAP